MKKAPSDHKLYLFTTHYPFGEDTEVFVENEVKVLAGMASEINVYPAIKHPTICKFAGNVRLHYIMDEPLPGTASSIFINNLFLILKIFWNELSVSGMRVFIKYFRTNLAQVLQAIRRAEYLAATITEKDRREGIFYSFWMNDWALTLAVMKYKRRIKKFIFRTHRYDLYDDLRPDKYIPFRKFAIQMCENVYTVCPAGFDYMKKINIHPEKIRISRLGVHDHGANPFDPTRAFTLVSCSSLNIQKRVEKIAEALKYVDFELTWIHFGGNGNSMPIEKFREFCASMVPDNIRYEFRGSVSNRSLMEFYGSHPINLFIHLSDSEAITVAIQEAASFGIPILAANAGGLSEIVNENTGMLIENDFDVKKVADLIMRFRTSEMNTVAFRKGVKEFWKQHFSAEKNYTSFFKDITNG